MGNSLAWGKKFKAPELDRLFAMCRRFRWDLELASAVMTCMAFETGETFDPAVRNKAGSGATGLIQFMPATALGLFYSSHEIGRMSDEQKKLLGRECTDLLAKMTIVQQLDYVEKYFVPYCRRIHCLEDMYMAILLPKYIGANLDDVMFTKGTVAYRQNSGLDKDSDGKITKREVCAKIRAMYDKGMTDKFALQRVPPVS